MILNDGQVSALLVDFRDMPADDPHFDDDWRFPWDSRRKDVYDSLDTRVQDGDSD